MNDPTVVHLRRRVDDVDRALVHLLAERRNLVLALAALKEHDGLDVIQPAREAEMAVDRAAWAALEGLEPAFVADLFERIVAEARRIQFERRG